MIVDLYTYFKNHPRYNKVIGDDYLIVEYKCPINSEEFQLWSETNMITYVISGRKDWYSYDKTYSIEGGDALFIRKGVYSTKQYFEVEYCVMLFFISDSFIRKFIIEHESMFGNHSTEQEHPHIFKINTTESFQSLVLSTFNYLQQEDIPKELVELKFKELLFNILLDKHNGELVSYLKTLNSNSKSELEFLMLKNFQHDLQIEDFAKLCGKSLSGFKRDFKTLFNDSPANWLKHKRLEYSLSLLKNSQLNVNEVAYESGFKNPSHYNKLFKQKYNKTPLEYRNS
ncbi:AraC family transcriptional regulator [Winogradskyella sp. 3972H.M.0a.05]|uniref:helix-turn-helix domain-containing protein n=1 Tax=Winogradskyella sp. 3972H.M.0a.05 TaxID=2950277 RepID=UPI0033982ABF